LSIGKFLLTKETIEYVGKTSWKFGRPEIIDKGLRYYDEHPEDVQIIVKNLEYAGLGSTGRYLDEVLEGIALHYYEKLFILTKRFEAYWIAKNRVSTGDSFKIVEEAVKSKLPVFVAQSHFGASYFMNITFMVNGFDITSVGKFPEPAGSMIVNGSNYISEKYNTGKTKLVNIADPDVDVPYEMFSTLLRGGILSNVFDENNQFSRKFDLLSTKVMGGSGMDQFLKRFNDEKMVVVTPFIVRTSDETFSFELDRHFLAQEDIIQSFYKSLEKRISSHPQQWYFIHELHEAVPEK
jgi:lauroyl/myristoyl acyltransferase